MGAGGAGHVALAAKPRVAGIDHRYHADDHIEDVEVGQTPDVEGIEEALTVATGQDGLAHVVGGEDVKKGDCDYGIPEIRKDALAAVSDHRRHLAAGQDDRQRHKQRDGHDQPV